jgi:hypothetical protein
MRRRSRIALASVAALAAETAVAEAPLSRIDVPVVVPLATLERAVEARTPPTFGGSRTIPLVGPLAEAALSWTIRRGPIALTGGEGWIEGATNLTGAARLGSRAGGAPRALGRLLDGLTGGALPGVDGIDAGVDLAGRMTLRASPRLRPDWRIDPNVRPHLSLREASIPVIGGARIDVAPMVSEAVAPQLDEVRRQIEALGETDVLERAAEQAWRAMCGAHPLRLPAREGAAPPPPLWLILRPVEASASQPELDSEALTIHVGVAAAAEISDRAATPECGALPPLAVREHEAGASVALRIAARHETIAEEAAAYLVGRAFDVGSGAATATPRAVRVSGAPGRLQVEVDAEVAPHGFWSRIWGPTETTVRIETTPKLDADGRRVFLEDSAVSARSADWLNIAGWTVWSLQGRIVGALEQAVVVDLAAVSTAAAAQVGPLAAGLNESALAGVATVEAELGRVDVSDIAVDAETVTVEAAVEGVARIRIDSIPAPGAP